MTIMILGIDLGKNSCSVAGLDADGKVVLRRRMPKTIVSFASKLAPCTVAMEACCGAHHLGRLLSDQGHEVLLMSPILRPYARRRRWEGCRPPQTASQCAKSWCSTPREGEDGKSKIL